MPPSLSLPLLENVRIASPCHVKWDDMLGDDRVRHCASCNLNVHNFSAMTTPEAERFLANYFNPDGSSKGRRVCAGMFRRADGTIIFADCPVGVARLVAAGHRAAARVAAAVGLVALAGWLTSKATAHNYSLTQFEPFTSLVKVMNYAGITPPQQSQTFVAGALATPSNTVELPALQQPASTRVGLDQSLDQFSGTFCVPPGHQE